MVVEVVAAGVGEDSGRQMQAVETALRDSVRGGFYDGRRQPLADEAAHQPLLGDGVRGGLFERLQFVEGAGAEGADKAGGFAGGGQQLRDEVGDGGFAVGAGDGDDRQLAAGMAVEVGGELAGAGA